jgi:hypothetical protein
MPLVIMRHRTGASLLHGKSWLSVVERRDLPPLFEQLDDGVGGRIEIEANHIAQLIDELRIAREFEFWAFCGRRPWARQMRRTALALTPAVFAIMTHVRCVVSPGGLVSVNAMTRSAAAAPSGGTREGRALSRSWPSKPSSTKRFCQRRTQGFDLLVRLIISLVPRPSIVSSTIFARHTCFREHCGPAPVPSIDDDGRV